MLSKRAIVEVLVSTVKLLVATCPRGIITTVMKESGDAGGNILGGIITLLWNHQRVMKEIGDTGGII